MEKKYKNKKETFFFVRTIILLNNLSLFILVIYTNLYLNSNKIPGLKYKQGDEKKLNKKLFKKIKYSIKDKEKKNSY